MRDRPINLRFKSQANANFDSAIRLRGSARLVLKILTWYETRGIVSGAFLMVLFGSTMECVAEVDVSNDAVMTIGRQFQTDYHWSVRNGHVCNLNYAGWAQGNEVVWVRGNAHGCG